MIYRLIILSILTALTLNSAEREYTKFSILGGINANFNLHSASFENLPGYESCCTEFNNNFGIGYNIFAGAEYSILEKLNYRFTLSYSNLSAVLSEEEVIGYDITDNDYTEILVDFSYDNTLPYIMTGHYANYRFSDDLPINVFGGFQVGLPLSPQTDYQEELLSPENRVFETGSELRNQQSGEINDLSSVYFGLTAGIGYEIYKFSHFTIIPEVSFTYALTDIVNSAAWRVNPLSAGLTVKYDIPVAKPEPIKPQDPPKPPLPDYPETPEKPILLVDLNAKINDKPMSNGDIYNQQIKEINTVEVSNVVGIVYDIDDDYIYTIARSLQFSDIKNIDIKSYATTINQARSNSDQLTNKLKEFNISVNNTQYLYSDTTDLRYPELKNELEKIEIFVNNDIYSDAFNDIVSTIYSKPDLKLNIKKEIESNIDIENEEGKIFINDNHIKSFSDDIELDITEKIKKGKNSINIIYNTKTAEMNKESRLSFSIETNIKEKETVINYPETIDDKANLILAYYQFDRSSPYSVNNTLKQIALDHLNENDTNTLTLIPSTDDLGSIEYNSSLALKRAESAKKLFDKKYHNRIQISDVNKAIFDNSTPIGRTKNRSVSIILNK